MDVFCDCRVLSGKGLCVGLITRPEESYRLWCVVLCDLETSRMRSHDPRWSAASQEKKNIYIYNNNMADARICEVGAALAHLFWDSEVILGNKC